MHKILKKYKLKLSNFSACTDFAYYFYVFKMEFVVFL